MKRFTQTILIMVSIVLLVACRQVATTNTIDDASTAVATMTQTPLPPTPTATPVPDTPTPTATATQLPATATATQQAVIEDSSNETYYDYGDSGPEVDLDASEIGIANFRFGPDELEVKAGTTVTWTNQDGTMHTVTSDDDTFDSGALENGGTFSFTFDVVGTFDYHCNFHPSMIGTIIVIP